jgi:hypothetical protein
MKQMVNVTQVRDETRATIDPLDAKLGLIVKLTNADPYVATVTSLLGVVGIRPTEEGKAGIRSLKSVIRAVAPEAMATFGPTIIMALFDGTIAVGRQMSARAPRPEPRAEPKVEPLNQQVRVKDEPQPKGTPDFDRFCADELEEGATYAINPTEVFELWKAWCAKRGIPHGTQKRFGGMMGKRFQRDKNNGYPRYLRVRARQAKPVLKVVSSNP